jgi:hypothetical protein
MAQIAGLEISDRTRVTHTSSGFNIRLQYKVGKHKSGKRNGNRLGSKH